MIQKELLEALKNVDEIEITLTGRSSGSKISRIVWFVEEDYSLYLLPVTGSESEWYKNLLKNPEIEITANGLKWTGKAASISDPRKVRDIADKFRAKYGAADVKKYYSRFDAAVEVALE